MRTARIGAPNDVRCISIEHKLGIHASPTCVMAYGEKDGAIGYLLGEPNAGLSHMFIMMNAARLSVGVQGLAQSERALQQAPGVGAQPPAGQGAWRQEAGSGGDHRASGCEADAAVDAGAHRGHARAGVFRGAGTGPRSSRC